MSCIPARQAKVTELSHKILATDNEQSELNDMAINKITFVNNGEGIEESRTDSK